MIDVAKIRSSIDQLSTSLLLNAASPNTEVVKEALSLNASLIDGIPNSVLSGYIVALGQYIVMLQHYENRIAIEYATLSKLLDFELAKKAITDGTGKSKSIKERRSSAIIADENLIALEELILQAEAEKMLMSSMVNAVSEFLNALKKEKSGRDYDRSGQY
jgi:hypothetical protein